MGDFEPANRAMLWLENRQELTGGWYGSYGEGASYFPESELPWAVKYYLDGFFLREKKID